MNEEKSLPRGWTWAKLGEVVALNPRTSVEKLADEDLVSFVGMASVEAESGRMDASQTRAFKDVKRGYTAFQEGDVLFAKITPCMENGKSAIARNLVADVGFGSTEFHVLRAEAGVSSNLIRYFVGQKSFRRDARANMTGSAGQLRVPTNFLEHFPFPLAPLEEQKRIAGQLDTLFSELDAGLAAIARARAKVKGFRASLLRAATSGELSATWRAQNSPHETGAALLKRLLDERRAVWEAKERAKRAAKSPAKKLFEDETWKTNYLAPKAPDTANLPILPESWCWMGFGQLCRVQGGFAFKSTMYQAEGIPLVRISNLVKGEVQISEDTVFLPASAALDNSEFLLERGDILVAMSGATTGKMAVFNSDASALLNQRVGRFKIHSNDIKRTRYVDLLVSLVGNKILENAYGAAQPNISPREIEEMALPLPPLAEQEWIVSEVERRLSLVSEVEKTLDAAQKRAQSLKAAILARAFRGELCEQNPDEESADELLKRIQTARIDKPKRGARAKIEQGILF